MYYIVTIIFTSGPLVEILSKDRIFVVGTIRKRALGFPAVFKATTPTVGTHVFTSVSGIHYFVFNDRKEVCFVTNVFPERMDSKVFRLQCNGVLREQSVPPLFPAYNKFMGACVPCLGCL